MICVCCNQKVRKLNPHRMDRHKVATLELMAKARLSGDEWIRASAGSGMVANGQRIRAPYRVQAHVSRLCWFGLAEHGARRSGLYRITDEGMDFLKNTHAVPTMIYCRDGVVVDRSKDVVYMRHVKNVVLDEPYWSNYWTIQK
jgi:hypothetical protein